MRTEGESSPTQAGPEVKIPQTRGALRRRREGKRTTDSVDKTPMHIASLRIGCTYLPPAGGMTAVFKPRELDNRPHIASLRMGRQHVYDMQ